MAWVLLLLIRWRPNWPGQGTLSGVEMRVELAAAVFTAGFSRPGEGMAGATAAGLEEG